jgi:hypothetical protein
VHHRHRAMIVALTVLTLTTVTSVATASPASAQTYKLDANRFSPMFHAAGCDYRVSYGTYGRPYAFLRIYTRACWSPFTEVTVLWTPGGDVEIPTPQNRMVADDVPDSCGRYQEFGGVLPPGLSGYGIGVTIRLIGSTDVHNTFRWNRGAPTSGIPC